MTEMTNIKAALTAMETAQRNTSGYSASTIDLMRNSCGGESPRTSMIRSKLVSGRVLSAGEIGYLKNTSESLYNTATKITHERKWFGTSLKRCKSKAEALAAKTSKIGSLAAMRNRITTAETGLEVNMRIASINDEYAIYKRDARYKKLPEVRTLKKRRRMFDRGV